MTITYEFGDNLYLNITNRCPCDCTFCIRNNGEGVGQSGSLWLEHEPDFEQIAADIKKHDLKKYKEIVFCGYGEPLMRLDMVIRVSEFIKSFSEIKIRLNTNGLGNLINKKKVAPMLKGVVDIISISLNAPDKQSYLEVTRPVYGEIAFDSMLSFAKECRDLGMETVLTVVDVIKKEQIQKSELLCREIGIPLRIRHAE